MPDDRIYDAINLFKFSPTGQGTVNVGGGAAYQAKYRRLVNPVVNKLWSLWSRDEIGFVQLHPNTTADSRTGAGYDIRVNKILEPPNDPATYQSAVNQGKLAATSNVLVHEALHLVREIASYPEEEILCRIFESSYFRDLISPRSYQSRVVGARCTAEFLPATAFYQSYQSDLNRLLVTHDLIDSVLDSAEYRKDLETDKTAAFISWSIGWWGGLSMRWPSTRGYFLRSLASRDGQDFAESILAILESLTRQQWLIAKTVAGDLQKIRRGLAARNHLLSNHFAMRIVQVQETLGENFGIRAR